MTQNGDDNVIGFPRHVQNTRRRPSAGKSEITGGAHQMGSVGGDGYRPSHVPDKVNHESAGEVIDLALVRDRLARLRGEKQNLTRRATQPDGEGNSTHTGSPTLSPTSPSTALKQPRNTKRRPKGKSATRPRSLIDTIFPDGISPLISTGDSPASLGRLSHTAIGILVPKADALDRDLLIETVFLVARAICPTGRSHRHNSTLVAGYTSEYLLTALRPRSPWVPLGFELPIEGGRVDLGWRNTTTGEIFYDEIKTTETTRRTPDSHWLTQCHGYAAAGAIKHGDDFRGVRLLPLGSMNVATLVQPDQTISLLRPTHADPFAAPTGGSR